MKKVENKILCRWAVILALLVAYPSDAKVLAYDTFRTQSTSDIVINDFEAEDYGDWQVTGIAFGSGPAQGTLSGQMEVSGHKGTKLVNTFYNGDGSTGTLTSPEFEVKLNFINFLIGGGGHEGETCMNLLANGEIVRTATGFNTVSGGSEALDWQCWDVREYIGKNVQIQIVDNYTGGWGHINVDHIYQSNKKKEIVIDKEMPITFSKKYLNLPVKNGAAKRWISVYEGDKKVREFDIELATDEVDFWVYLDISEFNGSEGKLVIDKYSTEWEMGLDAVAQGDSFPGQEDLYKEKLRPQIHYTSRRGWVNDTNGLVYHDGLYHMFYQHNPYGWGWGNMTWGHAVSSDLLHWDEWGDAIHPDELGTIFSGSAVVDHNNTASLQTGSEKTMVAFYTSAGNNGRWSSGQPFTQSMAYSNDGGKSWVKYADNPVIGNIAGGTRDPKVLWHEPSGKWVMILWIDGSKLSIFTSENLKTWQHESDVDGFFECPELFELAIDGDEANTKWVVYGADGDYKIGSFDGNTFTPETAKIKFEYGNCFYASQTYNNVPDSDGRRIQVGWGRGIDMHGMAFNQMILLPVELTLHSTPDGPRVFVNPIREIESLHNEHFSAQGQKVSAGSHAIDDFNSDLLHIKAELEPQGADYVKLNIHGIDISYDVAAETIFCQGRTAPLALVDGKFKLELVVDRMSIEIFANDGLRYMPIKVSLTDNAKGIKIISDNGDTMVHNIDVYELESVWK